MKNKPSKPELDRSVVVPDQKRNFQGKLFPGHIGDGMPKTLICAKRADHSLLHSEQIKGRNTVPISSHLN